MEIHHAIRLLRDACVVKHLALNTEQSYTQWLMRCAAFLKAQQAKCMAASEAKIEAFLGIAPFSELLVLFPLPKKR